MDIFSEKETMSVKMQIRSNDNRQSDEYDKAMRRFSNEQIRNLFVNKFKKYINSKI